MIWRQRNPDFKTVADVVAANTGRPVGEFEKEKEWRIEKMPIASAFIKTAIEQGKKINVLADYDADGICSAAILRSLLVTLGADPYIRIPKRMSEGYGLNPKIVDEFGENSFLICVDNGIAAFEAIEKAKAKGITVVILDHHAISEAGEVPRADVVIDPSAIGEADFTGYCGAGLAYKLTVEMLGESHPVTLKCLSFAAIATVADVMPLVADNHFIVKKGLKMMLKKEGQTRGLAALIAKNGLDVAIDEMGIGFKIAPCLNAPGRLYDDGAMKSYRLLICDSSDVDAGELANEVIADNKLRIEKKEKKINLLDENIMKNNLSDDVPLIVYESGLEEGFVGLLAGHYAEAYKRPCIVFTDSSDGDTLKGSARSYGDVHLKHLLDKNSSLICKYGGHKGAAGLSIKKDNLDNFRNALKRDLADYKVAEENLYDLEISASQVPETIKQLMFYAPYGEGNPAIVFKVNDFEVSPTNKGYVQTMSEGRHAKLANKDKIFAIAFNMGQRVVEAIENKPKTLTLYGKLALNVSKFGTSSQVETFDFDVKKSPVIMTSLADRLKAAATTKKI